jgi:hypothetical protein
MTLWRCAKKLLVTVSFHLALPHTHTPFCASFLRHARIFCCHLLQIITCSCYLRLQRPASAFPTTTQPQLCRGTSIICVSKFDHNNSVALKSVIGISLWNYEPNWRIFGSSDFCCYFLLAKSDQAIFANGPTLVDDLSEESKDFFDCVKRGLTALSIPFSVDPRFVFCARVSETWTLKGMPSMIGSKSRVSNRKVVAR